MGLLISVLNHEIEKYTTVVPYVFELVRGRLLSSSE